MTRTHFLYKRKSFSGHLETGADTFAITASQWPSRWPKMETITQLDGIGQPQNSRKTSNELYWRDGEDCGGTFWQYNVSHLYYTNTVIAKQIFQQGLFQIMDWTRMRDSLILSYLSEVLPDKILVFSGEVTEKPALHADPIFGKVRRQYG